MKEELSCELREGVMTLVVQMQDVVKNDVVDKGTGEDSYHYEDTGLGQDPGQPGEVVEDDLEEDGTDDHPGEHDRAGELRPLPAGQVNAAMV